MLIVCPECKANVSSLAPQCPHCGFPISSVDTSSPQEIKPLKTANTKRKKARHMKLPNGSGSIKHLSGKRRKPYAVYPPITKDDYDDMGVARSKKAIGYFATYQEAYECLLQYSKLQYDADLSDITLADLWKMYQKSDDYMGLRDKVSKDAMYKWCAPLENIPVRQITPMMCMKLIDSIDRGAPTKKGVKVVMSQLFTIALNMNILLKNPVAEISVKDTDPVIDRIPFTDEEVSALWRCSDREEVMVILILLYSGMRVNELLKNTIDNLNLEEKYLYIPKELAKNNDSVRNVPLHDRIIPLVKHFYHNAVANNSQYLMTKTNGTRVMYNNFASRDMKKITEITGIAHRFHDTRHTFATKGQLCGIEELFMQKILGHSPANMLRKTYTHIEVKDLLPQLNRLHY